MKIGIVGSRQRDSQEDLSLVREALTRVIEESGVALKDVTIVSGGCPRGGDRFAEILANEYGLNTIIFKAEWSKYGRGAGFRRNIDIARESEVLIACVAADRIGGTEDTIRKFVSLHPKGSLVLV